MNKKITSWRMSLIVVITALAFGLAACTDDDTKDGLQLHYTAVTNMGPSMVLTSTAPSYKGAKPSSFAIKSIKLDDQVIECPSFSISSETGIIQIENTDQLATGLYSLSISCVAGGHSYTFPDVFTVNMMKATPEEIIVSPAELIIPLTEVAGTTTTAKVSAVDEAVSVMSYGLVQEAGKEYFSISNKGEIGINKNFKGEFLPGVYDLTLSLRTYAGTAVYPEAVRIQITSAPLELTYVPAANKMEFNTAFTSPAPALKGSTDELIYSIKAVTPATDKIAIDAQSGVLSVAADNALPVGESYTIDVTATNKFGVKDFETAFTLNVVDFINPISNFSYAAQSHMQGLDFSFSPAAGFVGDDVLFEFSNLDTKLAGKISIDAQTGAISALKGNSIPLGTYTVAVKASNVKNEQTANVSLTITKNPYYFTYFSYGNNLSLSPVQNYPSQFRFDTKANTNGQVLSIAASDIPQGQDVEWSMAVRSQPVKEGSVPALGTSTIDPATGAITLGGATDNHGAMLLVTATVGKGQVGETTVTIPVFVLLQMPMAAQEDAAVLVQVHYDQIVFCVNPRKGGRSTVPTLVGVPDAAKFFLDYRRNFNYWNVGGPATHVDGYPADAGSFMGKMWGVYNAQESVEKKPAGTGAKDPLSYYTNLTFSGRTLATAMLYVDAVNKTIVVNANKWIDSDDVAASGVMFGSMTFRTNADPNNIPPNNNNPSAINNGAELRPIFIWFDEKF